MLLRQLVLCVPFIYVLGKLFGLDYLWLGYGAAELISAIAFTPVAIYTYRKLFPSASLKELAEPVGKSLREAEGSLGECIPEDGSDTGLSSFNEEHADGNGDNSTV